MKIIAGKKVISAGNNGFTKINLDKFERLCSSDSDYSGTQIDGNSVLVAHKGDDCIGMYYVRAKVGSVNSKFKGDALSYSEQDHFYPYE